MNKTNDVATAAGINRLDGGVEKAKRAMRIRPAPSQESIRQKLRAGGYHPAATVSLPALLHKQSDQQFRRLVQDLLTVSRRLEMARDYFGRRINVTGPQYNLLMTVAQLQGTTGIGVGLVAQAMHV